MSEIPNPKALHKDLINLQEQICDLVGILGELELRMDLIENSVAIHRRSDTFIKDAFARDYKGATTDLNPIEPTHEKKKESRQLDEELRKALAVIDAL